MNLTIFKSKAGRLTAAMAVGLTVALTVQFAGIDARCQNLKQNVLRLHILANSDTEADQATKLAVRDKILAASPEIFENAENINGAIAAAQEKVPQIKALAEQVLAERGANYGVKIEIGKAWFNTREYSTFTLPAGEYMAVRVLLGSAKGHNWWCVMFPQLCVPSAENAAQLSDAVQQKSADMAEHPKRYKVAFKAVEIFESLRRHLRGA